MRTYPLVAALCVAACGGATNLDAFDCIAPPLVIAPIADTAYADAVCPDGSIETNPDDCNLSDVERFHKRREAVRFASNAAERLGRSYAEHCRSLNAIISSDRKIANIILRRRKGYRTRAVLDVVAKELAQYLRDVPKALPGLVDFELALLLERLRTKDVDPFITAYYAQLDPLGRRLSPDDSDRLKVSRADDFRYDVARVQFAGKRRAVQVAREYIRGQAQSQLIFVRWIDPQLYSEVEHAPLVDAGEISGLDIAPAPPR